MSNEIDSIHTLLGQSRRKLQDAERQVLILKAEVAAYEKVYGILTGQGPLAVMAGVRGHSEDDRPLRRARGLSEVWRKVFGWIGSQAVAPNTDEIWRFTDAAGLGVNRNTLRSQLSVYTDQGVLIRIENRYSLSTEGLTAVFGEEESRDRLVSDSSSHNDVDSGVDALTHNLSEARKSIPAPQPDTSDL